MATLSNSLGNVAFALETVSYSIHIDSLNIEIEATKSEFARHNATIYGVDQKIQFISKDILDLKLEDIQYPPDRPSKMDVFYMSPPWGGIGYNLLEEYKLDYLYPDFTQVLAKALHFSRNLIIFLPKNTSINELIDYLMPFAREFSEDPDDFDKRNELVIEIEQIVYGESCKGIHVYTGDLAKVETREVAEYFY